MTSPPRSDEVVIPALLRAARESYSQAIGVRLLEAGFEDIPRNAPSVLGGMADHGGAPVDLIRELGVTKQAASRLIDTLVVRGYVVRQVNPDDRRRVTIALTDRGRAAASAVRSAVESVDAELESRLSAAEMVGLRAGLSALAEIRETLGGEEMSASSKCRDPR
jgi:DNA-binding MarR family transcriptional regulator